MPEPVAWKAGTAGSKGRRRGNAPPLPDWKPPYYLLEAEGFECRLLNARRLVCPARGCRQTFREQVPGVLERYQRRTSRLTAQAGAVARDSSCPGDGRTCTAGG